MGSSGSGGDVRSRNVYLGFAALLSGVVAWVGATVSYKYLAENCDFNKPATTTIIVTSCGAIFIPWHYGSRWIKKKVSGGHKRHALRDEEEDGGRGVTSHFLPHMAHTHFALSAGAVLFPLFVFGNVLDVVGSTYATVASHGVFISTQSFFSLLITVALDRNSFTWWGALAAVCSITGALLVAWSDSDSGQADSEFWGNLACVGTAFTYALYATMFDYISDMYYRGPQGNGHGEVAALKHEQRALLQGMVIHPTSGHPHPHTYSESSTGIVRRPFMVRSSSFLWGAKTMGENGAPQPVVSSPSEAAPSELSSFLTIGYLSLAALLSGPVVLGILALTGMESFGFPTNVTTWAVVVGTGLLSMAIGDGLYLFGVKHTSGFVVSTSTCFSIPLSIFVTVFELHKETGSWEAPLSRYIFNIKYLSGSLLVVVAVVAAAVHLQVTTSAAPGAPTRPTFSALRDDSDEEIQEPEGTPVVPLGRN